MATIAPDALRGIYRAIRAAGQFRSMREGGIVGDVRHQRRGGYHISRQDQTSSSNYSIQAPADKRGPANLASAIDITLNPADMRLMTQRLMDACKRNHANPSAEPRVECVREFFGTLNGRAVTGWNRYKSGNRGVGLTSSDSSHLWHVHISIFRDYADDIKAIAGLIGILLGKPLTPGPKPPDEGEDVVTEKEMDAIAERVVKRLVFTDGIMAAPDSLKRPDNQFWTGLNLLHKPVNQNEELRDLIESLRLEVAALADRGPSASAAEPPEDQP